jgi:hypothetical protein
VSGVTGPIRDLRRLAKAMRALPKVTAQRVAAKVAPELTDQARASFAAGQTVYGDSRPAGVDGAPLTLERTGATKASLRFVSVGTIVRASLGTPYARYLIGKYKILPSGNAAMPVEWSKSVGKIADDVIARTFAGGGL